MRAVLAAIAALAILVGALIAQTFVGNGAMLAILLVPLAAYAAVKFAHGHAPRARGH